METIFDEAHVPDYALPDVLSLEDGTPVTDPATWPRRRDELLGLFRSEVYGRLPGAPPALRIEPVARAETADGRALRRAVTLHFTEADAGPRLDLLIYTPREAAAPVPVFLGLNFAGNHTVEADAGIPLPRSWVPERTDAPSEDGRPIEAGRGAMARRWPVSQIVERGYGLVTAYYGDLFPDRADGFDQSVYAPFAAAMGLDPAGGDWGAISAWAWGLHRMRDYLERDDALDADRAIAMGHSRLAKTALWAGATDPRLAMVLANASGCGGAALSRRRFGERLIQINTSFPHWFCARFKDYNEQEASLPVDQHELVALAAPRPVMVNAMAEDQWADPKGMFLALKHAAPVWDLLGAEGLSAEAMPAVGSQVLSRVGFRHRAGRHDVLAEDWQAFLDFADRHLPPAGAGTRDASGHSESW